MQVYYDKDADLSIVQKMKVVIVGYGSQGHAHANNLRDSGVTNLVVGLRKGSGSWVKAENAGFDIAEVSDAVQGADLIMILVPDELQPALYRDDILPNIKQGAAIAFAHGFNVHFELIEARDDLDVLMIAPKGPGHTVRSTYVAGGGVPSLIAIAQDPTGQAKNIALSYASANGGGRAGVIETTFREETETDLFGEQAVLTGGIPKLIQSAYKVLLEAGYNPITAWFVCYYELKTIVDMFHSKGFEFMNNAISDTAEYGGITRGNRIIDEHVQNEMRIILKEIQNEQFHNEWMLESKNGYPALNKLREEEKQIPIEEISKQLLKELFENK